jgi:hypothetical protein
MSAQPKKISPSRRRSARTTSPEMPGYTCCTLKEESPNRCGKFHLSWPEAYLCLCEYKVAHAPEDDTRTVHFAMQVRGGVERIEADEDVLGWYENNFFEHHCPSYFNRQTSVFDYGLMLEALRRVLETQTISRPASVAA